MHYQPSQHRSHRMNFELKGRDDAKVSAPTSNTPEQIRIFSGVSCEQLTLRGYRIGGQQVI
jgi:hypothetical protein